MSYIEPLFLCVLLVTAAGLLRQRRRRLAFAGLAALFAISWPPVDWLLSRPLEVWYPPHAVPAGGADAIVVLSGNVDPPRPEVPFAIVSDDTYQRCKYAAWLYLHWRPLPVLACGGGSGPRPFAVIMEEVLASEGVPAAAIRTEERSRTTHENALFAARILRAMHASRIVLVTDARHMLRAERCFRKENFAVTPAPSRYRVFRPGWTEFFPGWRALRSNDYTLHEICGFIWYRLRGWA